MANITPTELPENSNSFPQDALLTRNEDFIIVKLPPEVHYEIYQSTIDGISKNAKEVERILSSETKDNSQWLFALATTLLGAFLGSLFSIGDSVKNKVLSGVILISVFLFFGTIVFFFLWGLALKDINNTNRDKELKIRQLLDAIDNGLPNHKLPQNSFTRELPQDNLKESVKGKDKTRKTQPPAKPVVVRVSKKSS